MGQSTRNQIPITAQRAFLIPLPPLPEQRKIAKILSTWDRAIELTDNLIAAKQHRKKALMQRLLTGKVRFPGFTTGWVFQPFSVLFRTVSIKNLQVKTAEYRDTGNYPIVDQGQSLIVGYTNTDHVFKDVPVIIFGDHTRIVKWVDFPFVPGADGTQVLTTTKELNIRLGYYLLQRAQLSNLGYSRHFKLLKALEFKAPTDYAEQFKIAEILSTIDREVEALERLKRRQQEQKKGLIQQLLTGKIRVKA